MTDLHWAAGFIEGEGSFDYHNGCRITVGQMQLEPLNKLQQLFGGGVYLCGKRQIGQWSLSRQAPGLMMTIFPLMSTRRKAQIAKVLFRWRSADKGKRNRQKTYCPAGHAYAGSNLKIRPHFDTRQRTYRVCRACHRTKQRARWRRAHWGHE